MQKQPDKFGTHFSQTADEDYISKYRVGRTAGCKPTILHARIVDLSTSNFWHYAESLWFWIVEVRRGRSFAAD